MGQSRLISDRHAMDLIHDTMSGQEWSPDTLDAIADIVGWTGRVIGDSDDMIGRMLGDDDA